MKTAKIEEALFKAPAHEKALFFSTQEPLKEIEISGKTYLGKIAPSPITLEELESLEAHLVSIFSRLKMEPTDLELLTIEDGAR